MTNFTFKMDRKKRESYSALCEAFDLSMSAATLALVRQAVRSQNGYECLTIIRCGGHYDDK